MQERISLMRQHYAERIRQFPEMRERAMYMNVLRYLTAVARVASSTRRQHWIDYEIIHACYPFFAERTGVPGFFYEEVEPNKFRAVSIFYKEEERIASEEGKEFRPLRLQPMDEEYGDLIDLMRDEDEKQKILNAAREVCERIISNGWNWKSTAQ